MNKTYIFIIVSFFAVLSLFGFWKNDQQLKFLSQQVQVKDCSISQIFIQLGDNYSKETDRSRYNDVTISFHTPQECSFSGIEVVQGDQKIVYYFQEIVHSFVNGTVWCHSGKYCESVYYDQYIHHFYLTLPIQGKFNYTIATETDKQGAFLASVPTKNRTQIQRIMYFGDLDNTRLSVNTWKMINDMKVREDQIDATIFLGDYAYEFYQDNGKQGDLFLQTLQPYSSIWPWMMTPGNHEDKGNWTFFNDKFRSPNYAFSSNHYYSFDIGLVHFIQVDLHYFNNGTWQQPLPVQQQLINWLTDDLIAANQNRANVPWIIVFSHKAVYCVSTECNDFSTQYAIFDDLFYQYGVDIFLGGHQHEYQFLKPIHKDTILQYTQTDNNTLIDPQGPIYIVQGNGGNRNMDKTKGPKHDEYLLSIDTETGIGMMTVYDANHIQFEYYKASSEEVYDTKNLFVSKHKSTFASEF